MKSKINKKSPRGDFLLMAGDQKLVSNLLHNSFEDFWVVFRKACKYFTIQLDTFLLHFSNKTAVRDGVGERGINFYLPQFTKIVLFVPTMSKSVGTGVHNCFVGSTLLALAAMAKAFGALQYISAGFESSYSSFNACHGVIGKLLIKSGEKAGPILVLHGKGRRASFRSFGPVRLFGIEMVLARFARLDFAMLGDLKTLTVGFIRFHVIFCSFAR